MKAGSRAHVVASTVCTSVDMLKAVVIILLSLHTVPPQTGFSFSRRFSLSLNDIRVTYFPQLKGTATSSPPLSLLQLFSSLLQQHLHTALNKIIKI